MKKGKKIRSIFERNLQDFEIFDIFPGAKKSLKFSWFEKNIEEKISENIPIFGGSFMKLLLKEYEYSKVWIFGKLKMRRTRQSSYIEPEIFSIFFEGNFLQFIGNKFFWWLRILNKKVLDRFEKIIWRRECLFQ